MHYGMQMILSFFFHCKTQNNVCGKFKGIGMVTEKHNSEYVPEIFIFVVTVVEQTFSTGQTRYTVDSLKLVHELT